MKLVGVENNLVNVGFGSNWLITSDKSINQNSYYFEVEFKSNPSYSTGYIGYLYKYPTGFKYFNNELGIKLYYPSFTIEILTNGSNKIYLTYYNNNKEIEEISKTSTSISDVTALNSIVGLGIKLNSDKSVNFDVYINGVLKDQIIKENFDDFDFNNLYIATFNEWNHNNQSAQYYFEKDLKYQNIASKYIKKFILFESGGGLYNMSDNNFQKLSDHKWDEISKDEKLSLLEQTKGLVPSIDQLKTLEQPIRIVTKAES